MRLHDDFKETAGPCLLGVYEEEIAGWIEDLISAQPRQVIDIGSGDGYYAVGLALRLPGAAVVAADTDERAQAGTRAQARVNDVADRVTVMGAMAPADLAGLLARGGVVFCDCEGYEDIPLDPAAVPALRETTIIVELHDFIVPGVTARLVDRFAPSHTIELRDARTRDGLAIPIAASLPGFLRYVALDEGRPPMQWARLTPKI